MEDRGEKEFPWMAMQDSSANDRAKKDLPTGKVKISSRRGPRVDQAKTAARLHKIRLAPQTVVEADEITSPGVSPVDETAEETPAARSGLLRWRRREVRKDTLAGWQNWSKFRLWRRTRPLWGSILVILGAGILLAFPLSLLQFAFLVNSFWASMVVGGVLLVMGVIPLFLPGYSVITGSIGMVLALVSFVTNTLGGCVIGMLLGIIGCALTIAWRPVKASRLMAAGASANS
jgi:Family of unknown function (DUF6114)